MLKLSNLESRALVKVEDTDETFGLIEDGVIDGGRSMEMRQLTADNKQRKRVQCFICKKFWYVKAQ